MSLTAPGARVLDALGDALRRRGGNLLDNLVDGLASALVHADNRLEITDRGWVAALDLDATPEPRWLGAAIGTKVPGGLTADQQRAYIRDRAYWRRGRPAAIQAAVATLLTGTQRVDLFERDGSPGHLRVRTYTAESAGVSASAVKAAATTQKPVGITIATETVSGASYDHLLEHHGPTYEAMQADFPSYDDLPGQSAKYHVPERGTEA